MRFRFDVKYFILFLFLFAVEVLIALFVRDDFVRPYVGDTLVVVLVYTLVQSVVPLTPWKAVVGVFVFACLVEVGQWFHLVDLLGLGEIEAARIIIGTGFEALDFVAYFAGACLVLLGETVRERGVKGRARRGAAVI